MLVSTVNMDAGIVKGRVYDSATNEPLIGATVIAGNHTQGASTDIDGHYTLQLTTGKYDLLIKLFAKNNNHLLKIIQSEIQTLGLARTETLISFQEVFRRQIPITEETEIK